VLSLAPKAGLAYQAYKVDYRRPVIDVYQEFIKFALGKSDKKRALDILCRAWAPTVMKSHDDPTFLKPASKKDKNKGTKKSQKMKGQKRVEKRKGEVENEKIKRFLCPRGFPD